MSYIEAAARHYISKWLCIYWLRGEDGTDNKFLPQINRSIGPISYACNGVVSGSSQHEHSISLAARHIISTIFQLFAYVSFTNRGRYQYTIRTTGWQSDKSDIVFLRWSVTGHRICRDMASLLGALLLSHFEVILQFWPFGSPFGEHKVPVNGYQIPVNEPEARALQISY